MRKLVKTDIMPGLIFVPKNKDNYFFKINYITDGSIHGNWYKEFSCINTIEGTWKTDTINNVINRNKYLFYFSNNCNKILQELLKAVSE